MLKWLCGFAIVASAIVSVAYEQHYAREKYQAEAQEDCIALAISIEEKHSCAKETQSRKDYTPWWYVLVTWPDGITTWAIIATGFMLAWQSSETRKAAKAGLIAANAAKTNADIAIGLSIPTLVLHKLTLNLHPDGKLRSFYKYPEFRIEVKNFGQSPAFVKSYTIDIAAGDVPDEPVYSEPWRVDMQEVVEGGSTYLIGEGRCSPKNHDDAMFEAFASGKKELIVYGYITYGDVFGSPIRTMKFCKIIAEIDFDGGHDPLMMDWGGPKYTGQSKEHKPN
jgi:hypothetical protein